MIRRLCGLLMLMVVCASPGLAFEARLLTKAEMTEWAASGRIAMNRNGTTHGYTCSGTLIAPDLVVSAAHCLDALFDAGPSRVRQVVFLAGWHEDTALASAAVQRIEFHPAYRPKQSIQKILPHDLVVLHLQTPITEVAPIRLGDAPEPLEDLSFAVYRGNGSEAPKLSTGCSHSDLPPNSIQVGCAVVGGNSGGGVFVGAGAGRRLVGVISAASGARALAVRPDAWLRARLADKLAAN